MTKIGKLDCEDHWESIHPVTAVECEMPEAIRLVQAKVK